MEKKNNTGCVSELLELDDNLSFACRLTDIGMTELRICGTVVTSPVSRYFFAACGYMIGNVIGLNHTTSGWTFVRIKFSIATPSSI